ncbi:sigma factor [Streptomyces sp. NPDC045714]|uniref:RNA polymerase sigma factor n=1 Tax=Streptomyces sp. NPDC045714 TaxID=3154913 RepID=UPI0033F50725
MTGPWSDDAAVIAQSLDRPERFSELYRRHARDIHQQAARRLGDSAADDITADTFLSAFRTRTRYDSGRASAKPRLHGIAAPSPSVPEPGTETGSPERAPAG